MTENSELDEIFPRQQGELSNERYRLGVVVGGSLSKGLGVKLDAGDLPGGLMEQIAVGRYVVVEGLTGRNFFSIITDVALESTNPVIETKPPDDGFLAEIYRSTITYGRASVTPMLVLEREASSPKPVKTIPAHFSLVYQASEEDVDRVFGSEDHNHFHIGSPLEMEGVKVNLDLVRFVQRSSGVFGKSGTGKSFITRTLLAGIINSRSASCLIFDMHNDYGWAVKNEQGSEFKGLQQLFSANHVNVITLDPQTSLSRGGRSDGTLHIPYDQIDPEDVAMLAGVLALSEVQVNALYFLRRKLGRDWFRILLSDEEVSLGQERLDEFVESGDLIKGTLGAIQRKFELFRRMDFLKEKVSEDVVETIFHKLNTGTSIVLEFGTFGDSLPAYMFVANYLTRRIHRRYVAAKNEAFGNQGDDPRPLLIVIEEAHKFLDPEIAQHTIFGAIARELRKYNVTLLVVDQRPSGIDDEVMSQIGTRVTCLLDNESDIRAVFSGVSGAGALREVLARLDTQQQALIMGHAVPMPVVIRPRDYGEELYAALGQQPYDNQEEKVQRAKNDLFGD